jgi:HAD superfamily hydrolase (TIGR01509 family)
LDEAAFSLSRHVEVEGDEELGIPRADLGEVRFLGIGYDAAVARGAEVLLRIRTPLAAAEIIRRHASARDGHESTHLRAVPVEAAGDFVLARAGEVLGGAAAAVAAWLSHLGHAEESRTVATAQKSPPVKAVVFDLDGVLIDSLQAHYEAWCEFLSPHGVNYSWGDFEQDIGPSTAELMERWIRRLSLGISVKEGVKRKEALFTERLKSRAVVFPGVAEGLGRLSAVPLAVATSAGRALTEAVLEAAGIGRAFRHVITSDDVPRTKPSPDVYRLAAKRLGVPAWVCAAVEDSPSGIEAAQAAGMRVIGVAGSFDRARLEPADRIVASTAEACRFLESEIRPS